MCVRVCVFVCFGSLCLGCHGFPKPYNFPLPGSWSRRKGDTLFFKTGPCFEDTCSCVLEMCQILWVLARQIWPQSQNHGNSFPLMGTLRRCLRTEAAEQDIFKATFEIKLFSISLAAYSEKNMMCNKIKLKKVF